MNHFKDEVEKQRLEFIQKLNGAFSSIQNQLLAVPAALLLAGTQAKPGDGLTLGNFLILSAYLIFAGFMTLTIRNQRNTLDAIRDQVNEQRQQMEREHAGLTAHIEKSYRQLNDRYIHQTSLLGKVDLLVAVSLALVTSIVVWFALK